MLLNFYTIFIIAFIWVCILVILLQLVHVKIKRFTVLYLLSLFLAYSTFALLISKEFSDHAFSNFSLFLIVLIFIVSNSFLFFLLYVLNRKTKENLLFKNRNAEILNLNKELEDILNQRKKREAKLHRYATMDGMTGAMKKEIGLAFLEQYLEEASIKKETLILCYMDINNLKEVNDTYGHKEGDYLIVTITNCIKENLKESYIFCRLGGDEFMLLLPGLSLEGAEVFWGKIKKQLDQLNEANSKPYLFNLSHGFAQYSWEAKLSAQQLLARADEEMYKEKQKYKKQKKK